MVKWNAYPLRERVICISRESEERKTIFIVEDYLEYSLQLEGLLATDEKPLDERLSKERD